MNPQFQIFNYEILLSGKKKENKKIPDVKNKYFQSACTYLPTAFTHDHWIPVCSTAFGGGKKQEIDLKANYIDFV